MGKAAGPQCSLGGPPPTPAVSTGESRRQRPPSPSCRAPSYPGHQVRGGGWGAEPPWAWSECSRTLGPSWGYLAGEKSIQAPWVRFASPLHRRISVSPNLEA